MLAVREEAANRTITLVVFGAGSANGGANPFGWMAMVAVTSPVICMVRFCTCTRLARRGRRALVAVRM